VEERVASIFRACCVPASPMDCVIEVLDCCLPIWTYGLQLWGTACTSNIQILERFQSKALRVITDAPRYVTNALLRRDLHIQSVKEEIQRLSSQYNVRLDSHSNLTANPKKQPTNRRLRLILPTDLPTRFFVYI
jgi:hypothetical protein